MKILLKNADLVLDSWNEIPHGSLLIENGKVAEVFTKDEYPKADAQKEIDCQGNTVYPGFIDLHVHGACGKDFIQGSESIPSASLNMAQDGTTAFLASLTVQSFEESITALRSLSSHQEQGAVCLGVHMEGPYLSAQYKALMDERYLRDPSIIETDAMIQASGNTIRTMTVAPERKGMREFIPYLCRNHIIPMIGHTACTCQQAEQAHLWGAAGFTHLYNAMSQHTHRDPGCVTAAFLHEDMMKEMILDGFHTDSKVVEMTYRCLGPRQIIMITDAMLGKGMPDGDYIFSGLKCLKEGIHVRVKETGRIAGSAFGMIDAFRFIDHLVHPTRPEMCALSSGNAAKLMKDPTRGNLNPGARADIAILSPDLQVEQVLVEGKTVYQNS